MTGEIEIQTVPDGSPNRRGYQFHSLQWPTAVT